MSDEARTERLILKIESNRLDIERAKMGLSSHERECALRYRSLEQTATSIETKVNALATKFEADGQAVAVWKQWAVGVAFTLLIGLVGWEGKALYDLQPLRAQAAQAKH